MEREKREERTDEVDAIKKRATTLLFLLLSFSLLYPHLAVLDDLVDGLGDRGLDVSDGECHFFCFGFSRIFEEAEKEEEEEKEERREERSGFVLSSLFRFAALS